MARKKRARAREIALQALYQYDASRRSGGEAQSAEDLDSFVLQASDDAAVTSYARRLVAGCLEMHEALDARIQGAVKHWKMQRIAPVDLSILRLALYEIFEVDEVPPKVAINEAIELAKRFSTARSGAFVNGILDRLYQDSPSAAGGGVQSSGEAPPASPSASRPDQDSTDAAKVVQ